MKFSHKKTSNKTYYDRNLWMKPNVLVCSQQCSWTVEVTDLGARKWYYPEEECLNAKRRIKECRTRLRNWSEAGLSPYRDRSGKSREYSHRLSEPGTNLSLLRMTWRCHEANNWPRSLSKSSLSNSITYTTAKYIHVTVYGCIATVFEVRFIVALIT